MPGAMLATVTIPLVQDTTPESEETFIVTLSAGQDVSITVESANVTILDTDGEIVIPICLCALTGSILASK